MNALPYNFQMQPATPPMQQLRADALAMEASAIQKRTAEAVHAAPPIQQSVCVGDWVAYHAPDSGYFFIGEALAFNTVTRRWLVQWTDVCGEREDFVGEARLTVKLSAAVLETARRVERDTGFVYFHLCAPDGRWHDVGGDELAYELAHGVLCAQAADVTAALHSEA